MKGFEIKYVDGEFDTVCANEGTVSGIINFDEFDEWVGMTCDIRE